MHGFFNTVLRINLTRQSYEIQMLSDAVLRRSLGGRGLASHLLLRHNSPGVTPLSPDNHVIFANGPTAGTDIWGPSCYGVFTKSPQNGLFTQFYAGGNVANHISSTGFDAVILHGASEHPVWVEVQEGSVVFHSAADFWRKSTYDTEIYVENWIKTNRPGNGLCGVVAIEPVSEARGTYVGVENHFRRRVGKIGAEAVLASKKVKAVVFWGNKVKTVADPEKVKAVGRIMSERFRANMGCKVAENPWKCFFDWESMSTMKKVHYQNYQINGLDSDACAWNELNGTEIASINCRLRASLDNDYLAGMVGAEINRGNAASCCEWQDRLTLFESSILCPLFHDYYQWDELAMIFEGVVGIHFSIFDFRGIAKNVIDDVRSFNHCEVS